MKYLLLLFFVACSSFLQAQITFRNTISLNDKLTGKKLAMTFLAIAIGANIPNSFVRQGHNYHGNRQGLVIDVDAMANPKKFYTYNEIVYKLYANNGAYSPIQPLIPFYLIMPMPEIKLPEYNVSRIYRRL